MFLILILLSLIPFSAWSETTLCDLLELDSCSGVTKQIRRSSSGSLPSSATAANLNPANVSFDRGFGIEASYQSHNPVNFNVATGSGKLGGALISQSLENSFFGNRSIELNDVLFDRYDDRRQYKSQKLNLAIGGKLLRQKWYSLDLGLLVKRHSVVKKVNTGIGMSGRLGPLHLGASYYKDDLYLDLKNHTDPISGVDYQTIFGGEEAYTEKFTVQTYSVGTSFRNLSLDAGVIKSKYDLTNADTTVNLYSVSVFFGKLLLSYAIRNEITPAYKLIDGELVKQQSQNETFTSLQYAVGKHLVIGASYNFYLLHELSTNAIIYF